MSERKVPEPEASPPDQAEMRRRAALASAYADLAAREGCPGAAERLDRLAGHYNSRLRLLAREEQAARYEQLAAAASLAAERSASLSSGSDVRLRAMARFYRARASQAVRP